MSVICFIKEAYDCTMPFYFILDCFKTQGICIKVVRKKPWMLEAVPDYFKTREMCNDVVEKVPWALRYVPDCFKTQEMCAIMLLKKNHARWCMSLTVLKHKKCVMMQWRKDFFLRDVPDWFVTQLQLKIIQYDWYNNDLIEWDEGYKKRKAQKAKIKEELMPITWHPSR